MYVCVYYMYMYTNYIYIHMYTYRYMYTLYIQATYLIYFYQCVLCFLRLEGSQESSAQPCPSAAGHTIPPAPVWECPADIGTAAQHIMGGMAWVTRTQQFSVI